MIDLKDNVLRVGGGEVAVPFLHGWSDFSVAAFLLNFFTLWIKLELIPSLVLWSLEKDIPPTFLDEERKAKEASSSGAPVSVLFIMLICDFGISYDSCLPVILLPFVRPTCFTV